MASETQPVLLCLATFWIRPLGQELYLCWNHRAWALLLSLHPGRHHVLRTKDRF